MSYDFFFLWLLPPLLGAVIGYFTNWLAIKMLFRPLREYRIFGLRVPFTPGLLPRERSRLAQSIGETVSSELLTAEVVQKRLAEPDVAEALESALRERLDEAFDGSVGELIGYAGLSEEASGGPLRELAERAWKGLVASDAFTAASSAALRSALAAADDIPLSSVLPPEAARDAASFLLSEANAERLKKSLAAAIENSYVAEGTRRNGFFGGLVPPEALEPLVRVLVEGLYRAAVPAVEGLVGSPEIKHGLERYAVDIVRRSIARLTPIQRLIVGAAQYDKTIAETMPDTVDDIVTAVTALLRAPEMPRRASDAAVAALESAAAESMGVSIARIVSREAALSAAAAAVDVLRDRGPDLAAAAAALAAERSETSLSLFLEELGLPSGELAARAGVWAGKALSGEGKAGRLLGDGAAAFVSSFGALLGDRSLGELLGADEDYRARLSGDIAKRALALVSAEAARIIKGLDVAKIVVEKIQSLDMMDVERITLGVVEKELTWITLLGGVLGGLIGLVQSLVMAATRG